MAQKFQALAVDIGASNGRALLGTVGEDGRLRLEEVRRFPNGPTEADGSLRWDFERLLGQVVSSIEDSFAGGFEPVSVGVDTWGVDYVLIDREGRPVEQPFAYRDHRTDGIMERFSREVMPLEELYSITGIQFMPFNTVFQLASEIFEGGERLGRAHKMLLMPDALAHGLSGRMVAEYTIASTGQMLDARARSWSDEIVARLGLRRDLLPEIVEPGTRVGTYAVGGSSGRSVNVLAPASHDTAAAVAAVPAGGEEPWAYISSGTWTLVGIEAKQPVLTEEAREAGLTNEGGVEGTYRQLSNVMGLWLIQECMRMWERCGRKLDILDVCEAAAEAPPGGPLVDPDHPSFLSPEDMLESVAEFCENTGQRPPEGVGPVARCVFESLALKTRLVIERIAEVTGTDPEVIHMVGGGTKNELLCRMTADAMDKVLIAGPAEATATGNLVTQAMAAGRIGSLAEGRELVRRSFELVRYEPSGGDEWRKMYERFRELLA